MNKFKVGDKIWVFLVDIPENIGYGVPSIQSLTLTETTIDGQIYTGAYRIMGGSRLVIDDEAYASRTDALSALFSRYCNLEDKDKKESCQHKWYFTPFSSKCEKCNYLCNCEFVSMRNAKTQTCQHCSREELA